MAIILHSEFRNLTRADFHVQAEKFIGIAFDVQNQLGRYYSEAIYQEALRQRCEEVGLTPTLKEVRISLSHADFEAYFLVDILAAHGLIVELKAAESLCARNEAQALQYLMLSEVNHGLLLNMGGDQVEKRFLTTNLTLAERRRVNVSQQEWTELGGRSRLLRESVLELIDDWGSFLGVPLYRNALMHLLGGPEVVMRNVPVYDHGRCLGERSFFTLSDDVAVCFSALRANRAGLQGQLLRVLNHTPLRYFQWVNISGHEIEFRTVSQNRLSSGAAPRAGQARDKPRKTDL
ncbi:MAG: GxxExxY protein [Pirellulaceae bacterium]